MEEEMLKKYGRQKFQSRLDVNIKSSSTPKTNLTAIVSSEYG